MATEKIFWADPYQAELIATVTSVNGNVITLDKTIFYGFSGGQESDKGTIHGFEVIRADKDGPGISYTVDASHDLKPGDEVIVEIDWNRRGSKDSKGRWNQTKIALALVSGVKAIFK